MSETLALSWLAVVEACLWTWHVTEGQKYNIHEPCVAITWMSGKALAGILSLLIQAHVWICQTPLLPSQFFRQSSAKEKVRISIFLFVSFFNHSPHYEQLLFPTFCFLFHSLWHISLYVTSFLSVLSATMFLLSILTSRPVSQPRHTFLCLSLLLATSRAAGNGRNTEL
jgi:hypothetical protein